MPALGAIPLLVFQERLKVLLPCPSTKLNPLLQAQVLGPKRTVRNM
jgi:hypothetical protein